MELVPYIDATGADALESFVRQAAGGTEIWLCGMQRGPLDFLTRMRPALRRRAPGARPMRARLNGWIDWRARRR